MQAKQSSYLQAVRPQLKKLIELLKPQCDYVSILATDSFGTCYSVGQRQTRIMDNMFNERGFVVRIYRQQGYQEFSFNELDDVNQLAQTIMDTLNQEQTMLEGIKIKKVPTPLLKEEPATGEFSTEIPETMYDIKAKDVVGRLSELSKAGCAMENIVECQANYVINYVNKLFLSSEKDLLQAYAYATANVVMVANKNGLTNYVFDSKSGWYGPEIMDWFMPRLKATYDDLMVLFESGNIEPGEYDVICPPETTGIIAHESFGHGVEMDMFVKNRSIAQKHLGDKVASDLLVMYDGPQHQQQTASYFFDDEGILADRTLIIDHGKLVSGMCDTLSAARLGVKPTGNGRRETFERKAYTRMSNTYFQPLNDKREDMIKSIKYGFIVDGPQSGMEDPKNWGIQCVYNKAREIKDGKLTGKVFTPVYMTGYVPDLLKSIDMISGDLELNGCGYCGKGYKEFVVVSDGGPYIKAKARLG